MRVREWMVMEMDLLSAVTLMAFAGVKDWIKLIFSPSTFLVFSNFFETAATSLFLVLTNGSKFF